MTDDYRSTLLDHVPGAEPLADDPWGRSGVAWHVGDPLTEQRAFAAAGLVDRSHRRVIRVAGPDRLEYLNTLLSQKLDDAAPGDVTEALDLDPQGRVLHHMAVTVRDDEVLLDVAPAQEATLLRFLTMMIFRSDVTVEAADLGILSIVGPEAGDVAERAAGSLDAAAVVRRVGWPAGGRVDVLVPRESLTSAWEALAAAGATPAGLMAWEAERVAALQPETGIDLDEKAIPHEAPRWIGDPAVPGSGAVHLHKGCYRGQETVARVDNLGRPPRTLVLLHLDGSAAELPEPGAPVTAGRRTVGRVGTVVHHHELGPIALALVKRSAQEGQELACGGCAVAVDPDSVDRDDAVKPGRAAVDRLRGRG
ncbi:CAF17-like 4Fe-4S cluster assembly/insertion protein YgfZ [Corynebacterium sp. 335C]